MKRSVLWLCATTLLVLACNNGPAKDDASNLAADTLSATADSTALNEQGEPATTQAVQSLLPSVEQFLSQQDPAYTSGKFEEGSITSFDSLPRNSFSPDDIRSFRPYLVYNSDSSKAVDLYSYNVVLVKKGGKTVGEGSGPDTEVALLDFSTGTRQRLYFSGPSGAVLDARWINRQEVLVMAGEIVSPGKYQPLLLRVHTGKKTVQAFAYHDTLQVNPSGYQGGKLTVR